MKKPIPAEVYAYIREFIDNGNFENADNVRVYEQGDTEGMIDYRIREARGCCGSIDNRKVVVNGKTYIFGFNYGH